MGYRTLRQVVDHSGLRDTTDVAAPLEMIRMSLWQGTDDPQYKKGMVFSKFPYVNEVR